jgi:translation initiation factor 2-alpha kinase 4
MRATFYRGAYANSGVVGSIAARSLVSCAQQSAVPPTRGELAVAGGQDMALRAEYRAWRQGSAAGGPRRAAAALPMPSVALTVVAPAKPPKALPRLLRDFTPGRVLGRGAFGVVVAARSRADPLTEYAIKMVAWPADVDAGALGEVRAMASLPPSANLVGYFGAWVEAGGEWVSELSACVSESSPACDSSSNPARADAASGRGPIAVACGPSAPHPAARRAAAYNCILPLSDSSPSCFSSDASSSQPSAAQPFDASAASLPGFQFGPKAASLFLAGALNSGLTRGVGAWLFLQMELVPFPTLAHWLRADGMAAVNASTRWRWVAGAAAG